MKPPVVADLTWTGDLRFSGTTGANGITIDGNSVAGPSPVQSLVLALAGCMAADVVHILTRGRHPLEALKAHVVGERAEQDPRRLLKVKVCRQLYTLAVNSQDLHSANEIGIADGDLAVKAPRALKRRVKHLRTVGGSHDNHWGAGVGFESVNFRQQLVEGLLTFVVAAHAHRAPPAHERIGRLR